MNSFNFLFSTSKTVNKPMIFNNINIPSWSDLKESLLQTPTGSYLSEQEKLRLTGEGLPHPDALIRRFGTTEEPRVVFYRDSAAWFV